VTISQLFSHSVFKFSIELYLTLVRQVTHWYSGRRERKLCWTAGTIA